ncbi:phospholipase A2 inhibitor and Ly6/PLAUR domain-containing protein-like [Scleropages formosus]|uniref:Phospholipase A2 inhibitor and Ly6/PLAUR domain-containing protein-like n=1 Tax=Scleropages formosus TaxID=113540 RepID=A0A8C9RN70_SCLFO|nr:phospholipase A2 inhibitor and Ly6/PLAUR domain-containing protein-like [Scleropages formosus]
MLYNTPRLIKMNLLLSLILAGTLFSTGHPLECFQGTDATESCTTPVTCQDNDNVCGSSTLAIYTGDCLSRKTGESKCVKPQECVSYSLNLGPERTVLHSECCKTDRCNTGISTEINNSPNGRKCFGCINEDNCTRTVDCRGDEHYCLKVTIKESNKTTKGCASKHYCDHAAIHWQLANKDEKVSCCDGNLCNDAQRLVLGALILLVPLVSIILIQ